MENSQQWKHLFPIGAASTTVSPLLLRHSTTTTTGPLFFNPIPHSLSHLFSSSSLIPPLHRPPILAPYRFLRSSSILPSTASSLASLSPSLNDAVSPYFLHNRIHLLNYPNSRYAVVFFPTGANDHKLGYFTLSLKDSKLRPNLDPNGNVFCAEIGSSVHRILRIEVNPVADLGIYHDGDDSPVIGYVLASTLYSVHWFVVRDNQVLVRANVFYLGGKVFKTCPVVSACWSPHILEESVVLLENGQLYLFDLESHCSSANFKGTRLIVPWSDSENKVWLGCEFSWHPRILVVARSDAVFLVDLRSKECRVTCLMKIEVLRMYAPYAPGGNERFLALSRAGPDHFYFTMASSSLLLLCDVRKPMVPVLQWMHDMDRPNHMTVLSLSVLRSHSREDALKFASESGFCIVLGSFWSGQFNLFCYGPELPLRKVSTASKLSKIDRPFYAWELPSEINLASGKCNCGSCLLREELMKDALPDWVDWQLKKEMAMGFGILSNDIAALLCEAHEHGGFTLIRLMSSGRLELQRYHAAWAPTKNFDHGHEQELHLDRHLLHLMDEEKYKLPKEFHYLKLHYLNAYASGNLTEFLSKKLEKCCIDALEKESFALEVHEFLCEKLKASRFGRSRAPPSAITVFEDVKPPTSIYEVALRRLWSDLPLGLLQFAFLNHSEFQEVLNQSRAPLDFLAVPGLPQLPPFFLRKSSPHTDNNIVGPIIPFPVLLVLNEFHNGCSELEGGEFSVEEELDCKYKEVMQVAREISGSTHRSVHLDCSAVSLADDGEETWNGSSKQKSFLSYHPAAFNCSTSAAYSDEVHDTFIFHVPEKSSEQSSEQTESVGQEIFDDLCPVELSFDAPVKKFESQGLKAYNLLKKQMSKWQHSFDSYKEFCVESGFSKSD